MVEFQTTRRIGPVLKMVSSLRELLRLRLKEQMPGPRLLEPKGTICHLTGQTRPWLVSLTEHCGTSKRQRDQGRESGRRGGGSDTVSSLLPHRVPDIDHPLEYGTISIRWLEATRIGAKIAGRRRC